MGVGAPRKVRKYGNEKVAVNGILFDSIREADRYVELKALERQRVIIDLELQPKYWLACGGEPVKIRSKKSPNGRRCTYRADFRYVLRETGETYVEDVKGVDTEASRLRRAVVEAEYGVRIVIVR